MPTYPYDSPLFLDRLIVNIKNTKRRLGDDAFKFSGAERMFECLKEAYRTEDYNHYSKIDYTDKFLQTIYWKIVRDYLVTLYKTCTRCTQGEGGLQMHHLRYAHRGSEHLYLEDLQVVCGICHEGLEHLKELEKFERENRL